MRRAVATWGRCLHTSAWSGAKGAPPAAAKKGSKKLGACGPTLSRRKGSSFCDVPVLNTAVLLPPLALAFTDDSNTPGVMDPTTATGVNLLKARAASRVERTRRQIDTRWRPSLTRRRLRNRARVTRSWALMRSTPRGCGR